MSSYNLSLTARRNYIAEFVLCETEKTVVAATATAFRRQPEDVTYSIGPQGTLAWPHFIIVRDENGKLYEPPGRTYTAVAGGPKATLKLLLNSIVGYEGYVPYSRIGLVELARSRGLATSVSGKNVRVVFPTGGEWDEDGEWGYRVSVGGGVIATGVATVARVAQEEPDEDDDDGGSSEIRGLRVFIQPRDITKMSDIQVTSVDGNQINVTTGVVVGPLPELQLAAGNGIAIASGGGVSTISANLSELSIPANLADLADVTANATAGQVLAWDGSGWSGANVPPGTTVNGLSGNVSLVAGDGVNITSNGTNLTLSATANLTGYATEQFVLDRVSPGTGYESPRDATLVQTYDGQQHYSWSAPDSYIGGYTLEIAEVGVTQDISGAGQYASQSDGSVRLTIQMDTTTAARVFVFASPTGADEDYVPIPYTVADFDENEVVVEGVYLSDDFASSGTHSLLAAVLDVGDEEIGTVQSQPITFGSHGSPQPPEFFSIDAMGLEITANVESAQTPHMLGFYPLSQITYYLEINQQADATSGWIRGTGVAATESIVAVSATATEGGEWYARVVAENPQGFGPPSEAVQVSGGS